MIVGLRFMILISGRIVAGSHTSWVVTAANRTRFEKVHAAQDRALSFTLRKRSPREIEPSTSFHQKRKKLLLT